MTYIYEQLSTYQIADALKQDSNAGWSYEGAKALAEYLEEYVASTGEPLELDIVAIRCEFSEYASLEELKENYSDIETMSDLEDHTTVLVFAGGIIIQDF